MGDASQRNSRREARYKRKPSRDRRAGIQTEKGGEPGFKQANRDSSRETQAEMGLRATARNVLRHGMSFGTDYVLRHAEGLTPDATRRRVAEEHAGLTSDATRRRVAEEHADEVTPDATRRRVAEEHAGLTSDATRRRVAEEHVDEVTPDATRRRVAEEHADGTAPGVGRDPASETARGPRDVSRAHASAAPGD